MQRRVKGTFPYENLIMPVGMHSLFHAASMTVVALCLMGVAGCGNSVKGDPHATESISDKEYRITKKNFELVKDGMTIEKVLAILGPPAGSNAGAGDIDIDYIWKSHGGNQITLNFKRGIVDLSVVRPEGTFFYVYGENQRGREPN